MWVVRDRPRSGQINESNGSEGICLTIRKGIWGGGFYVVVPEILERWSVMMLESTASSMP